MLSSRSFSPEATTCQAPFDQTSTQEWLPGIVVQQQPTSRAGIPSARQTSMRIIEMPVQDAMPMRIEWRGDWRARSRLTL